MLACSCVWHLFQVGERLITSPGFSWVDCFVLQLKRVLLCRHCKPSSFLFALYLGLCVVTVMEWDDGTGIAMVSWPISQPICSIIPENLQIITSLPSGFSWITIDLGSNLKSSLQACICRKIIKLYFVFFQQHSWHFKGLMSA